MLFGTRPSWSASDIWTTLNKKGTTCTLQAVYRELRALIHENIIFKVKTSYVLNSHWVLRMQAFCNVAARTSFSEENGLFLLASKKKQTWRFESLLDMDILWGHILLYSLKHSQDKIMLGWHPYSWFYLFHNKNEEELAKSLRFMGVRYYLIVGNSCFVNRWATQFMIRDKIFFSLAPGPFRNKMDMFMTITGDHIVTVKMAPETARRLADIFENTQSIDSLPLGALTELFTKEGHCTLTLEHNPKKSQTLRAKFSRYFGEKF